MKPLRWQTALITLFCVSLAVPCFGQYRLLPGKTEPGQFADCSPRTAARICLGTSNTDKCYAAPNDENYIFGLQPSAKRVGQGAGRELTLFTATFSGCGSGTLTSLALLTVKNGKLTNLLPKVELTNQSEHKLWQLPSISKLPVLATADFIWDFDAGETHFAPHRYTVELFVFDASLGQYTQRIAYETKRKYPGLDDADSIRVLDAEKADILAKLKQGPA